MISDKAHDRRLQEKDAVIVTDYYDSGTAKTRSSDHTRTDDVVSGVILAKKYFLHGRQLHQETEFNPGMLYSFVFPVLENGEIQCPNCGGTGRDALFSDGCPYCGAFYNMEYQSELLGSRDHSDYVTAERKGLILPFLLIMAVSVAVGIGLALMMGRTATAFDYGKGALIGGLIGAVLFLVYCFVRSGASLTSKEMKKKREQDIILERFRRDLKDNDLTMGDFVNGLNLGLGDYYFGSRSDKTRDIIDFDVLDYRDQQVDCKDGQVYATVDALIRLVSADQTKVWSGESVKHIRLKKSSGPAFRGKSGLNITACPYCGASIDLTARKCTYCGTEFRFERPLNIEKVSD